MSDQNKELETTPEALADPAIEKVDHIEQVKIHFFQILDHLTHAKVDGQLSGTIQLNLHKRIRDTILTMWKSGDVRTALIEAKKIYDTSAPGQPVNRAGSISATGTKMKVFSLTPDMFNPYSEDGKKKRLILDPAKGVSETTIGMLPNNPAHIRTDLIQVDPRPLWRKLMDLNDDQLIEQMGELGALKDFINGSFVHLLPDQKPIHPRARKESTMEKVRHVFDQLKAQEDVKKKEEKG